MAKTKRTLKQSQDVARSIDGKLEDCNHAYTSGAFKYLRILVHLIGAAEFIYALYYWQYTIKFPEPKEVKKDFGGKLKFLTYLNVILQAIYHILALLNDFFGSNAVDPQPVPLLRKVKDYIFAAFAFPIAHNVCLSFWVVYAYDRELIFPSTLDAYFPNWLNHVAHTNIAMLIILDMFTCFRRYPKRSNGLKTISIAMLLYLIWLHIDRYYSDSWAYPLFDVLNFPMRYFMMSGIVAVSVICYFVGEYANGIVWAPEMKLLQQKEKAKAL